MSPLETTPVVSTGSIPFASPITETKVIGISLNMDRDTAQRLAALLHASIRWTSNVWANDLHDAICDALEGPPPEQIDVEVEGHVRRHVISELSAHVDEDITLEGDEFDSRSILLRRLDRG